MSNVYNQNPIVLTAAMASGLKSFLGSAGVFNVLRISKIYFENPINVGDVANLQTPSGIPIQYLRCETANQSQLVQFDPPRLVPDLQLLQLDSGTLYVYLI